MKTAVPYLTREEVGLDVFAAIAACARAQQVLGMIAVEVHKGRDTTELAATYHHLKARAQGLVQAESISGEDAARLAREYPWLLA